MNAIIEGTQRKAKMMRYRLQIEMVHLSSVVFSQASIETSNEMELNDFTWIMLRKALCKLEVCINKDQLESVTIEGSSIQVKVKFATQTLIVYLAWKLLDMTFQLHIKQLSCCWSKHEVAELASVRASASASFRLFARAASDVRVSPLLAALGWQRVFIGPNIIEFRWKQRFSGQHCLLSSANGEEKSRGTFAGWTLISTISANNGPVTSARVRCERIN